MHHLDSWIKRDQLEVICFIISLFNAHHVSDVNKSILRSLRLIWWVISWVVLLWFDVYWCYGVVWLGWCGIRMQAEACSYNLIGPPSYMWSVVDRNVIMRRMTVQTSRETTAIAHNLPCRTATERCVMCCITALGPEASTCSSIRKEATAISRPRCTCTIHASINQRLSETEKCSAPPPQELH